jgi:hypothetical protein
LPYIGFEQKSLAARFCQLKLPLFFTFSDVSHQCQAMSELCVEHLWYGKQPNAIARQMDLSYIFF